ncbi:MAG: hypothetical protein ACOC4M_11410 [Promethearchaeia archaeon]
MSKTRWLRDDQNFKLKFGSENNNWFAVSLAPSLIEDIENGDVELKDGMYFMENGDGDYVLAEDGDSPAWPMLEMEFGYDNEAIEKVTVSIGSVIGYTRLFEGTPEKNDLLKVNDDHILEPIDTSDGDSEDMAVAEVTAVYDDYIEIWKKY